MRSYQKMIVPRGSSGGAVIVVISLLALARCSDDDQCSRIVEYNSLTPLDRDVVLVCRGSGGVTCSGLVEWRKDNRTIDAEALGVSYDGAMAEVANSRPVHEGNWTCHSSDEDPSEPYTFRVPPYRPNGPNAVGRVWKNLGENFTLGCDIAIGPVTQFVDGYSVEWTSLRLGGEILEQLMRYDSVSGLQSVNNVQYHESNFSISILNFSTPHPQDRGVIYACRISTNFNTAWGVTALTRVSFQPACLAVSQGLGDLTFLEPRYSRKVFTVKFTGCTRLNILWTIGNRTITPRSSQDSRYTTEERREGSETTVYLSISPVGEEDGGEMVVKARGCSCETTARTTIVLQSVPHSVAISPRPCQLQPGSRNAQHHLIFSLPHTLPSRLCGYSVEIELLFTEVSPTSGRSRLGTGSPKRFPVTTDISGRSTVRVLIEAEEGGSEVLPSSLEEKYVVQMRLLFNGTLLVNEWSPFCNATNTFTRKCERVELSLRVVANEGTGCSEEIRDVIGITSQLESTLNAFHFNTTIGDRCHSANIALSSPSLMCSSDNPREGTLTTFASAFVPLPESFITEFKEAVFNGSIDVSSAMFSVLQKSARSKVEPVHIVIACLAVAILVTVLSGGLVGCVIGHKCRQRGRREGGGGGGSEEDGKMRREQDDSYELKAVVLPAGKNSTDSNNRTGSTSPTTSSLSSVQSDCSIANSKPVQDRTCVCTDRQRPLQGGRPEHRPSDPAKGTTNRQGTVYKTGAAFTTHGGGTTEQGKCHPTSLNIRQPDSAGPSALPPHVVVRISHKKL